MNGTKFAYVYRFLDFQCFIENYGCMHIIVAEAKKLTIIDYFVAFFCKVFSIIELLEEAGNWRGWIPMASHAIGILCEIGGGNGSVIGV